MSLSKLSIEDLELEGKRVVIRVDFNVPIDEDGKVVDDTRIKSSMPTIKMALDKGAKCVVLISHLGRPKGRDEKFSLYPVAKRVSKLLGDSITFIDDCVGECVENTIYNSEPGKLILLENLRFYTEEEEPLENKDGTINSAVKEFRQQLTALGDVFINDAFATAHRAHSSIVGINLPVKAAGLLMMKEINAFKSVLFEPARPLLAILGGAKVKDKIQLIKNLLEKIDAMIIGGAMAYTFLKVTYEIDIGDSLFDEEGSKIVKEIMDKAEERGVKVLLPEDFIIADRFDKDAEIEIVDLQSEIKSGWIGLDIGPKTIETFTEAIKEAQTIVWNGPMGVFEWEKFENGTHAILDALIERTESGGITVVGGGDTVSAVTKWQAEDKFTHVSTGGGASLELLEGKELPGVAFLDAALEV